jgi:hypothetical protein
MTSIDPTQCRLLGISILLNALVALTPLAYASPPDPAWIPGIYDAADLDDVVQLAVSLDTGPRCDLPAVFAPLLLPAESCCPLGTASAQAISCSTFHIRAPPFV